MNKVLPPDISLDNRLWSHVTWIIIVIFATQTTTLSAQDSSAYMFGKNSIDIGIFGNKGFFSAGYNRTVYRKPRFNFLIGTSVGFVPGSGDDDLNVVPTFWHLNVGSNVSYHINYSEFTAGASYSKILLSDPYHSRPRSNYNRILGDFGYVLHFATSPVSIKLSFTPILFDDGTNDVQNIPVLLVFRSEF